MQKKGAGKTYTIFVLILGVASIAWMTYRLYESLVKGDNFRTFMSGALIIFFTVLTVNNYIKLRALLRSDKKSGDNEPVI